MKLRDIASPLLIRKIEVFRELLKEYCKGHPKILTVFEKLVNDIALECYVKGYDRGVIDAYDVLKVNRKRKHGLSTRDIESLLLEMIDYG